MVSNEVGEPYSPAVLSRYWRDTVKAAGVRHIKLHAARHTCATLMHLQGVPVAVIAAWIGHEDASLTMRRYAHSQDDALRMAGESLNRLVATRPANRTVRTASAQFNVEPMTGIEPAYSAWEVVLVLLTLFATFATGRNG